MSENEALWQKIDKHDEELAGVKENIHGISERMNGVESRLEYMSESHSAGQARIEALLEGLQTDVTNLNEQKLINKGYSDAKKEQNRLLKWLAGLLVGSGGTLAFFFGDKLP